MRTSVVLGLLACAVLCAAGETTIYDFLKGDWDIYVYKTPFANAEMPEDIESNRYTIEARNGTTSILDGFFMTEDGKDRFQIRTSGQFVGEYLIVKSEDGEAAPKKEKADEEKKEVLGEDMGLKATEPTVQEKEGDDDEDEEDLDLQTKCKFNFINVTDGHFVSQGTWGEDGVYQAIISTGAKPSFTMTIYKIVDGKTEEYTTVLAKKVLPPRQPSFMQKYGMLIMMGVMMMMNMAKTPSMAPAGGAGAEGGDAAAAAPAADAAPAASN